MMPTQRFYSPQRGQRGAALVIGLVLLLILTVLGVSGLGTATTEVRLADNKKQREFAFQAAESAVNEAIRRGGLLVIDGTEVENEVIRNNDYTYDHTNADGDVADAGVNVAVQTAYRGEGPLTQNINGSCGTFQFNGYRAVHFVAHADATAGRGARSTVRRGFCIAAPN